MKLNGDFLTYEVGGGHVLVSVGKTKFSGMVRLNDTAAFITELLKRDITKEDIVSALLKEYDVERETAERDVDRVIGDLRSIGAITE